LDTARVFRRGLACLSIYLFAAAAIAAAAGAPMPGAVPDEEVQELDEIEVTGTRLWKMRQQIVEMEDRFFALYNELNTNDDFDVTCRVEAPLGTRLKKRNCKVAYVEEAEAEEGQAFVRGEFAPDSKLVALERQAEYRAAAVKVINSDKRLRRLLEERIKLEESYEAERKRRFKGRWILFD
jgi:hypothetical protein